VSANIGKSASRRLTLLIAIMFVLSAVPAVPQDAVGTALNKCAGIAEDDARLTCYDALAVVLIGDQGDSGVVAPAVAVASAATPSGPAPLTDAVGKERIEPKKDKEREKFAGQVVSCKESAQSGQTYFVLENDQVWKQSNYRRLGFRDCQFDIEISKNAFGYEMYIPSKDRTVRISRVK
jgi:hypothetical protein